MLPNDKTKIKDATNSLTDVFLVSLKTLLVATCPFSFLHLFSSFLSLLSLPALFFCLEVYMCPLPARLTKITQKCQDLLNNLINLFQGNKYAGALGQQVLEIKDDQVEFDTTYTDSGLKSRMRRSRVSRSA